jgi:cell division protein FtsB
MRWLVIALVAVGLLIQYRLWISPDGVREVIQLRDAVAVQKAENEQLTRRNQQLAAEVRDLKQGFSALEERARSDLGMIARNETYYQVVPQAKPVTSEGEPQAAPVTRTAAR